VRIPGLTYGLPGVERGQFVTVPTSQEAQRLYAVGLAQPAHISELGQAYIPVYKMKLHIS